MRTIKFRAWDKEGKKMIQLNYLSLQSDTLYTDKHAEGDGKIKEVMQYTGLLDKHGKEIWEGDIVEGSVYEDAQDTATGEEEEHRWKDSVYFSNGCFALEKRKELLFNFQAPHKKLEIIGNIYQNSDLLS